MGKINRRHEWLVGRDLGRGEKDHVRSGQISWWCPKTTLWFTQKGKPEEDLQKQIAEFDRKLKSELCWKKQNAQKGVLHGGSTGAPEHSKKTERKAFEIALGMDTEDHRSPTFPDANTNNKESGWTQIVAMSFT